MKGFTLGAANLFLKGLADITIHDPESGNIIGYDKVLTDGSAETSQDEGIITAAGDAVVAAIPHGARLNGTFTSQAFSLAQRALTLGTEVTAGAVAPVCKHIKAEGATLKVSTEGITIARAEGQKSTDKYGWCHVCERGAATYSGVNYGIDLETGDIGVVTPFIAEQGKEYDVFFFVYNPSAEKVEIGSTFSGKVGSLQIKYMVYANSNNTASNSTLAGYLYLIVPMAKFTGGAGVAGNQTSNATTDYSWTALTDIDNKPSCDGCGGNSSPYGYYVYVPCGDTAQSVERIAVIGGGLSLKAGATAQIPVKYVVNGQLAQPTYSAMQYQVAETNVAEVSNKGVVTAKSEGDTNVAITLSKADGTTLTATCRIIVSA